jgi:hypothetical protein
MSDEIKVENKEKTEGDSQKANASAPAEAEKKDQQQWDEMNKWVLNEWENAIPKEITDLVNRLHTLSEDETFISKFTEKIVKSAGD